MTEQKLNKCMLLHVHKDLTDDLDLFEIAKDFIVARGGKKQTLWQFCSSVDFLCSVVL